MDTDGQKFAAWFGGMFFGIWLVILSVGTDESSILPGWTHWLFMLGTIIAGFFGGAATNPPISNWTKWVALGSAAVALQIFLAFTFDYILSLTGIASIIGTIVTCVSMVFTSWMGGFIIGAYLTQE